MKRPWRTRIWFYKPTLDKYGGRWPIWFGNDEYHWKTLVIGWGFTGRIIFALREFTSAECAWGDCAEVCVSDPRPWEATA